MDSTGLDMAEVEEKMFEFAISLLAATIQDGGMRERSIGTTEVCCPTLGSLYKWEYKLYIWGPSIHKNCIAVAQVLLGSSSYCKPV